MHRQDARLFSVEGCGDIEIDSAIGMMELARRDMLYARHLKPAQHDLAVDTERRHGDVPVPAEMALRLAQHVAVRNGRIVGRPWDEERLFRLPSRAGRDAGMDQHLQRVFTRLQRLSRGWPVSTEAIVGIEHQNAVEIDRRHRVDAAEIEIPVAFQHFRREVELALDRPVFLCHPPHVALVAAGIGIGNEAGGDERTVHVARHAHGCGVHGVGAGGGPGAGKVDGHDVGCLGHWCVSELVRELPPSALPGISPTRREIG